MHPFPDRITHNFHPARGIGGNISNLPRDEAERILDNLRDLGRNLRPDYLAKRLRVEDWLIAAKNAKLGRTQLHRPLYFFLGDFADGKDAARPDSLVMPLAAFSPDHLTFTYADSMTSYLSGSVAADAGVAPYFGQVFTRKDIEAVVAAIGLPNAQRATPANAAHASFIEVQVWDDRPIKEWIAKTARFRQLVHHRIDAI